MIRRQSAGWTAPLYYNASSQWKDELASSKVVVGSIVGKRELMHAWDSAGTLAASTSANIPYATSVMLVTFFEFEEL